MRCSQIRDGRGEEVVDSGGLNILPYTIFIFWGGLLVRNLLEHTPKPCSNLRRPKTTRAVLGIRGGLRLRGFALGVITHRPLSSSFFMQDPIR